MIKINSIILKNFRCYDNYRVDFTKKNINIFLGNNATGKTSIVEAISLLSICRSFRTSNDKEMIKREKEAFYLEYSLDNQGENNKISIAFDGKTKKIVVNNKTVGKLSDFFGKYKVVSFIPEDIRIITGEPKLRRKFLDLSISIYNRDYLKTLLVYNKILKERNELLKNSEGKLDNTLFKTYTDKLIECGKLIINERSEFINKVNGLINDKVLILSNGNDKCHVNYRPNVSSEEFERRIYESKDKDLLFKTTNVGPHRDDFSIYINENDASSYGSQGQIKTASLAIKLCCVDIVKEINDNILIILDDVFGELDGIRQNQILKLLNNEYQMFITTTSIKGIDENILNNSNIFDLNTERR